MHLSPTPAILEVDSPKWYYCSWGKGEITPVMEVVEVERQMEMVEVEETKGWTEPGIPSGTTVLRRRVVAETRWWLKRSRGQEASVELKVTHM